MSEEKKYPRWSNEELGACYYCDFYRTYGTHASEERCFNPKSPEYDSSRSIDIGTRLNINQIFKGCEGFKYGWRKIPAFLFKIIPKDSILREIPPEQIVKDFKLEMDLESELTLDDLINRTEKAWETIKKYS